MKKPKYLYHGSGQKLKYLVPRKPIGDDDPRHSRKGVYTTQIKKYALGMAVCRSSPNISAFNNRKTFQQNIIEGWPNEDATIYLYVLDSKDFEPNAENEYIATKKVEPVRVEEYKVSDLRHLWRKSNTKELKIWLKDRDGWRAPEEKKINLKFKKCVRGDYNFIYRIVKKTLFPYLHQYFKPDKKKFDDGFLRDYKDMKIIMRGKRRVGFYQVNPQKNYLDIIKIFLSPNYQGKGVGKAVMMSFENLGYKKIRLQCWDNNPARNFYKKLNYKVVKRENHKIHMEKVIR